MERPRPDRRGDRAVLARRCPLVPGRGRGAEGAGRPAQQPLFLDLPPDTRATGLRGGRELLRLGRRLRGVHGRELEGLTTLLTGSLGQFIDSRFESRQAKALLLANNLYGKHGGPYQPGTLIGLAFHLLSGGEHAKQGFFGHVMGGMGAISGAIASAGRAAGMQIATGTQVARILVNGGRAAGIALADGTEIAAGTVLSGADPKRTFLQLVEAAELPGDFRAAVGGIKMDGPCGKVNLVLDAEPQVRGMPANASRAAGRCSPCRRTSRSPTHATTMPNEVSWPVPTSCSSTAWSRPPWTPRWPRPAATS